MRINQLAKQTTKWIYVELPQNKPNHKRSQLYFCIGLCIKMGLPTDIYAFSRCRKLIKWFRHRVHDSFVVFRIVSILCFSIHTFHSLLIFCLSFYVWVFSSSVYLNIIRCESTMQNRHCNASQRYAYKNAVDYFYQFLINLDSDDAHLTNRCTYNVSPYANKVNDEICCININTQAR